MSLLRNVIIIIFSVLTLHPVSSFLCVQMLQRQSQLATEFFNRLVSHGDLSNDVLNKLAVKMWNLAQHRAHMDVKLRVSNTH